MRGGVLNSGNRYATRGRDRGCVRSRETPANLHRTPEPRGPSINSLPVPRSSVGRETECNPTGLPGFRGLVDTGTNPSA